MQWCWWPILVLLIPYIILATLGVVVIQYAFSWCATDTPGGRQTVSPYFMQCVGLVLDPLPVLVQLVLCQTR